MTDEPDEVNEVPHSRVLDIAWECQGMQFLSDMLADRVDREPGSCEAEMLQNGIREVRIQLADDDVGGTDIVLPLR